MRSGRSWGAALLLIGLLALVLGVFGAVYFERSAPRKVPDIVRNQPLAPSTAATPPQTPAPTETTRSSGISVPAQTVPPAASPPAEVVQAPPPPAAAPPALSAPPAPQSAQVAREAPAAPVTLPQPAAPANQAAPPASLESEAENLARISPSAAPADIGATAPRYWVEFGAYDRPYYAKRLRQSLDRLGVAARVSEAPGRHGRTYIRVRTEAAFDRAAAEAMLGKTKAALHIAPLLHRVTVTSPGAARIAAPDAGSTWVQFGAYRGHSRASAVAMKLRKNGIQATVFERKYAGHEALYLVRATDLRGRAAAVKIAQQGAAVLHTNDVMIGDAAALRVSHARALHPRPPPR